ncbi:NepR family anti-sigma factor [Sphingomonas sp. ac-8]|uniref:NepR family anti-sigma factor n=1 Tax=Sphingomonas sp. ac-8 TaxID=3242977 RepID=UPI003A8012D0
MTGSNEAERQDRAATTDRQKPQDGKQKNVGDALRAVYQDAAGEQIPDEMLDLLSKLQ